MKRALHLAPPLLDNEQRRALRREVEAVHEVAAHWHDVHLDHDALEEAYRRAWDQVGVA